MQPDELTHRLWWKLGDAFGCMRDVWDERGLILGMLELVKPVAPEAELRENPFAIRLDRLLRSQIDMSPKTFIEGVAAIHSEMTWELMGVAG